jgi:hypothetical protein
MPQRKALRKKNATFTHVELLAALVYRNGDTLPDSKTARSALGCDH